RWRGLHCERRLEVLHLRQRAAVAGQHRVSRGTGFETVEQALTQRIMERTEDEIVRRVGANLSRGGIEIAFDGSRGGPDLLSEVLFDARRPCWIGELGVDEIGRPPTPEDGAAAKAKGKPWEILIEAHRTIGLPGLTPHSTRTALAGRVEVGRQVLNVLGQRERARFQD